MEIHNEMKLSFISKSANEGFARVAVAAFVSQLDPTIDELSEIKTAVSEAVTNSVVHGYRDRLGTITITARILPGGRVSIVVVDKGCGIENTEQAMEPLFTTSTAGDRAGMGFTIMQSFMDKMTVRSTPGKGTKVSMEKRLSARVRSLKDFEAVLK